MMYKLLLLFHSWGLSWTKVTFPRLGGENHPAAVPTPLLLPPPPVLSPGHVPAASETKSQGTHLREEQGGDQGERWEKVAE